ncbi:MAG: LuxR C-terminal-related transcriptional regulator, partial [Planctomycetota bacterium]
TGKSNKEIAYLLHRSVRTIEVHRSHLMRKLDVDNVVDLVKRAAMMGLVELPAKQKRDNANQDAEKHQ